MKKLWKVSLFVLATSMFASCAHDDAREIEGESSEEELKTLEVQSKFIEQNMRDTEISRQSINALNERIEAFKEAMNLASIECMIESGSGSIPFVAADAVELFIKKARTGVENGSFGSFAKQSTEGIDLKTAKANFEAAELALESAKRAYSQDMNDLLAAINKYQKSKKDEDKVIIIAKITGMLGTLETIPNAVSNYVSAGFVYWKVLLEQGPTVIWKEIVQKIREDVKEIIEKATETFSKFTEITDSLWTLTKKDIEAQKKVLEAQIALGTVLADSVSKADSAYKYIFNLVNQLTANKEKAEEELSDAVLPANELAIALIDSANAAEFFINTYVTTIPGFDLSDLSALQSALSDLRDETKPVWKLVNPQDTATAIALYNKYSKYVSQLEILLQAITDPGAKKQAEALLSALKAFVNEMEKDGGVLAEREVVDGIDAEITALTARQTELVNMLPGYGDTLGTLRTNLKDAQDEAEAAKQALRDFIKSIFSKEEEE